MPTTSDTTAVPISWDREEIARVKLNANPEGMAVVEAEVETEAEAGVQYADFAPLLAPTLAAEHARVATLSGDGQGTPRTATTT